jgi:hypothetical protein
MGTELRLVDSLRIKGEQVPRTASQGLLQPSDAPGDRDLRRVTRQPSQQQGRQAAVTNTLDAVPQHDIAGHDTSTTEPDCVCGPEVRPATQEDGSVGWLLVHHSLDGREQAEG